MSTELFLNFLGIRLDSAKAEGHRFTINLRTPDTGEEFIVELDNATLTNIKGYQTAKADLTLTINRADLEKTLMGGKSLEAQLGDGTAKFQGDPIILKTLAGMMTDSRQPSRSSPALGEGARARRARPIRHRRDEGGRPGVSAPALPAAPWLAT